MRFFQAIACVGFLLALTLLGAPVTARAQGAAEANDLRTYGTATKTFLALTPYDFVPIDSTVTFQPNFGPIGVTISRTGGGALDAFRAPLHLPEGALVTEMEAVFCDTSATSAFSSALFIQPRMNLPIVQSGPSSTAADTPGCVDRTVVFSPPVTIDNNNNAYFVQLDLGAADDSIQFGSLRVGYVLQVSPPPATARFNDVPTNHIFFPFIEALAAAGITGGCSTTPPLYCPDDPVTRGQMAVFISRALGLHFAP